MLYNSLASKIAQVFSGCSIALLDVNGVEINKSGYSRVAAGDFSGSLVDNKIVISNNSSIVFNQAQEDWGQIAGFTLYDNTNSPLISGLFVASKIVYNGDILTINAGQLRIELTD